MNETLEYQFARIANADQWVPASGGQETPFTSRSGVKMLYCWNPQQNKHAYLNVTSDIIMTNEEASAALMM